MPAIALVLVALGVNAAAFKAEILASNSATAVLQRHCFGRSIRAVRSKGRPSEPPADIRAALRLQPRETVRHRRVKLKCGPSTYSVANNWYVKERVTPEMNARLEMSDTPYGRVVSSLNPTRITLEAAGRGRLTIRAVLVSGAGLPLSGVVERYRVHNIAH